MKKVLLSAFFLCFCFVRAGAQGVLHFSEVPATAYNLAASFSNYRIVALSDSLETLAEGASLTIRLDSTYTFTLRDSKLFSENYTVSVQGPGGIVRQSLAETGFDGAYFTSDVLTADEALVFSSFGEQYSIYLEQAGAEWYVEPLSAYLPAAPRNLYVQYKKEDIVAVNATCGNTTTATPPGNSGAPEAGGCFVTELAIGCDYTLFQEYGSIAATINRTATITNLTRADYKIANGLQDDIGFKIVEHYIVTCDTCNPWTVTSNINTNLTNITNGGMGLFLNTFDLAQWWFNNPAFGGGTVGLAWLSAVCTGNRYNAILDYSTVTNSMRCVNTHEIGHNFSCQHDAGSTTTIMAPSVSGSSTWSTQSINQIAAFLSNITCLSTCPTTAALCDTLGVHNLSLRKDTVASTVTVKWLAPAGTSYRARLYNFSTASWTAFTTAAAPLDSIVFSIPAMQCSGKFKVDIMPVCTGPVYGGRKQVVFNWSRSIPLTASITASPTGAVCAGSPITYTAATNAVSGASYQWKMNGGNVGTNSPTYTASATSGAVVTVVVTLAAGSCYTGSPVTSNALTMITTASVTPSVSIAASPGGAVCAAQPVTFTATPTNGGSTPSYQWKKNGANVGTNSASYTASGWVNGDFVTVVMTSAATCASPATATSNAITLIVSLGTPPSVSIIASQTAICAGTSITFTATAGNAGAAPLYQWRVNGAPVGTNLPTYTSTALANGDVVTCRVTSNALCTAGDTATSNAVTMTVAQPTTPVITASLSSASVCSGTPYMLTASPAIAGASYQWYSNGGAFGAAAASISVTNTAGIYAHYVVVTLPAGGCYTSPTVTSNTVTATVVAPTVPTVSITASATAVCAGTSATFTAATNVAGAAFQWKVNGVNAGPNAATFSYTPAAGDAVTCIVTAPAGACYSPSSATSNAVTITVNPLLLPTLSLTGDTVLCGAQTRTYVASTNIAGGTQWAWTVAGAPQASTTSSLTATPTNGAVIAATATALSGCYAPNSATASVSVDVATPQVYSISLSPGVVAGPGSGKTVTYTAAVAGVMPYVIRWYNFGAHVFSSTIPQWTHVIPAGGRDSVWAWISPVGTAGCFIADSIQSNAVVVEGTPTGIQGTAASGGLSVYPNPARDAVYVNGLRGGEAIRVLNNLGQIVERRVAASGVERLDVRRWAAGVYLMQIISGDGETLTTRIVRE